ncbi:MAG: YgiQ family radical SAM protein [Clostridiales bacterium]|jgi:uncharacterized radical SAM protein YgiQ|nr:YgiQ family radical SAM protein [Clostridiales bacterium]
MAFLPISPDELSGAPDFVLVTGDAYVDHPSFGAAIIGRLLTKLGYCVAVLAQPDWNDPSAFTRFGRPRLGFLVTGGNIDSMVSNYSVARKRRSRDAYSPGGAAGNRPDRAAIVYSNKIRAAYKDAPIILGGLEASLRRLAHYDYWSDRLRRSILLDANADLLVYGMGERQTERIAALLAGGATVSGIADVPGTVWKTRRAPDAIILPSYAEMTRDKQRFGDSFRVQYENTDALTAKALAEYYDDCGTWVVQNPPAPPLDTRELDAVFSMPFERAAHPVYDARGGVPSVEEVSSSLISSRGCFGACAFCALTFHQGRVVTSRSHKSLVAEAVKLTREPGFKGYINDVGGPTANFRRPACDRQLSRGACPKRRCLAPEPCRRLVVDHRDYLGLLRKLRAVPGVKKVFVRSGIRYDYLMLDPDPAFMNELCEHHVSGQLKVAPEHVSDRVLRLMGKPLFDVYRRFKKRFEEVNRMIGREQYLVPYLMSSHPGSDMAAAVELMEYLRANRIHPEQVQDFYPTPGTLSTCMYYTGRDPLTGEEVYVPRSPREKAAQRALLQYWLPQNRRLVAEALAEAERNENNGHKLYIDKGNDRAGKRVRRDNKRHRPR